MRISEVRITIHDRVAPEIGRMRPANGRAPLGILRIVTDSGIIGHALLGSFVGWGDTQALAIATHLRPKLLGRDPLDIGAIWRDLWAMSRVADSHAIGAVDVALWDIAGQSAGLPIHRMLGTYRDSAPAYFSSWWYDDESTYVDEALYYKSRGWKGYKIHPFGEPARDIALCTMLREAVGKDMTLMLDPFCAYTYVEALRVGRAVEELGFAWLEDPINSLDIYSYRKLREKLDIPILATELTPGSIYGYAPWILARATDMLRGVVSLKAGITPLIKIVHLAEAFGMPCEIHESFNSLNNVACLHVIMASPVTNWVEVLSPGGEPFTLATYNYGLKQPIVIDQNGAIAAPERPGLGYDLDWDLFESTQVSELV